jgi:putative selenate reductase
VVIEPGSIISACADGRRAAEAICEHLGVPFAQPHWQPPVVSGQDIVDIKAVRARRIPRARPAMLPVSERSDFGLIESTFTDAEARAEGRRCVQCTTFCDKCVEVCPNRANYTFTIQPACWTLPVLGIEDGGVRVVGHEDFRIVQNRQILHVDDFCNECDDCQTFCVHHGRPYADKPRLFLDAGSFEAEASNAFRIEGDTIRRRERGRESRLTVRDHARGYEDGEVRVTLSGDWRVIEGVATTPCAGRRSLRPAAEMAVLYDGITKTLPFLLVD